MRRTLAAVTAAALLVLGACSSGGDGASDGDSGGGGGGESAESRAAIAEDADAPALLDNAVGAAADEAAHATDAAVERAVISTGNVALRSPDAAQALFDVEKVADRFAGEVEQKNTEIDKSGEVVRSRLVLRIPSDRFAEAMTALEGAGDLISSGSDSKDVTTQVLDVDIRVRVQRRSIERIALLLDRAESIRDIVAIEAQLSQRQADLASLEKQQDVLADQTSMSTISVSVERTSKQDATEREKDEAGFLSGLDAGWDALKKFGVGLATFLGAVLPWAVVLLVLAIPGWPLLRRLRRRPGAPQTS
ncbi:MAG TPA: DUF4349 domain-containing protein [Nocardioides sp.]|uniref:DUF4349 domain-containing protein n=1 Tax=Nocardioides sp. TaxID=35761 RepID=UPI002C645174|nr:DUF4349 domain-containing protein [Nocardioides sp.]HTW15680.1 DUF4349 domain-containing protein [Nocardioides sp.]